MSSPPTMQCSFCGKSQQEVKKMIAGPNVFICDECISLCTDIIDEEGQTEPVDPRPFARRDAILAEAKRALSEAFPERSEELLRDLERIVAPRAGPFICSACTYSSGLPKPVPTDWACEHWRVEHWTEQGFATWADAPPDTWPWMTALRRIDPATNAASFVVLAPALLDRPLVMMIPP